MRFDKHKVGIQSNKYVQQYGLRLLPDLNEGFNPMSSDEARYKEVGIDLRSVGFGYGKRELGYSHSVQIRGVVETRVIESAYLSAG